MATFHPFPRLPFELRAWVWRLTVEYRIIDLVEPLLGQDTSLGPRLDGLRPAVPATLQACREARNMKLYSKHTFCGFDQGSYVWINFNIDIFDIGDSPLSDDFLKPVAPLIRRLMFGREAGRSLQDFFKFEREDLDVFVNVEEIYIVCDEISGIEPWFGGSSYDWPCGAENVRLIDVMSGEVITARKLDEITSSDKIDESPEDIERAIEAGDSWQSE
jgi:hypothetical protein